MSQMILDWSLFAAQLMLGIGMLATLYRMVRGPRAQDRILALDALYVVGLLLLVTLGIRTGSQIYFELAMLIGLLGFVGTVALADGYILPENHCVSAANSGLPPELGAMGLHYIHPGLLEITGTAPKVDGKSTHTDWMKPSVLIYEPQAA